MYGSFNCVVVEKLDGWVQFVTVVEAAQSAHELASLGFDLICGNTCELFGEAFCYGSLFSAGFGGTI